MWPDWYLTLSAWVVAVAGLLALAIAALHLLLAVENQFVRFWRIQRMLAEFVREASRTRRRTRPATPPEELPNPRRSLD